MKKLFLLIALVGFLNSKAQDVSVINTQDVFTITMGYSTYNPADGGNLIIGTVLTHSTPATNAGRRLIKLPFSVTCIGATIIAQTDGTLGTTETATVFIRVNGTDNAVNSSVTFDAINRNYTNSGLSISIPANTTFEGKIANPTWATNPTNTSLSVTYFFRRD